MQQTGSIAMFKILELKHGKVVEFVISIKAKEI